MGNTSLLMGDPNFLTLIFSGNKPAPLMMLYSEFQNYATYNRSVNQPRQSRRVACAVAISRSIMQTAIGRVTQTTDPIKEKLEKGSGLHVNLCGWWQDRERCREICGDEGHDP